MANEGKRKKSWKDRGGKIGERKKDEGKAAGLKNGPLPCVTMKMLGPSMARSGCVEPAGYLTHSTTHDPE